MPGILEDVKKNVKDRVDNIQQMRTRSLRKDGILKKRVLSEGDGLILGKIRKVKAKVNGGAVEAASATTPGDKVAGSGTQTRARAAGDFPVTR